MNTSPVALYLHIPFCLTICPYCDFSVCQPVPGLISAYLDALEKEIVAYPQPLVTLKPETIFIGGGTPTAMSVAQLERLMRLCHPFVTERLKEFTVEANPNGLTRRKLVTLLAGGVNRLSLGVQTFSAAGLKFLGRRHTPAESRQALSLIRTTGFANISLDLIYAWQGQTLTRWREDLDLACQLQVPHVSCYNLTYEKGTPLAQWHAAGRVAPQPEAQERELFDCAHESLTAAGLPAYEISNFARPEFRCRHNLHYWQGEEYAAFGVGAHGYQNGTRFANHHDPLVYIKMLAETGSARVFSETLTPANRARECAIIWLRLREGINVAEFANRTGFSLTKLYPKELTLLLDEGLLAWRDGQTRLALTSAGLPLADSVCAELAGEMPNA